MKKILPIAIAGIVFFFALLLMRPEETVPVVVAAMDLPGGHILTETDLQVRQSPGSAVPTGAVSDPTSLIGKTLSMARVAGDLILPANLGGENLQLAADERAIAIHVSDSAGLAGLLKPGDRVGLTVTFGGQQFGGEEGKTGAFAKNLANGLRVLYISPDFIALDPASSVPASSGGGFSGGGGATRQRKSDGVIVLAVPTGMQIVAYDFLSFNTESQTRTVSLVDLLPALDQSKEVALSLLLEPKDPAAFSTSGVFLPDLVIEPGPTPTAGPGTPVPGASAPVKP